MTKMVVFHVISHLDVGGAERVAFSIASSTNPAVDYHIVEVIRGRSAFTQHMIRELRQRHIAYHRSYVPAIRFHYLFEKLATWLFPLWFLWLFLCYKPAIIHSHTEIPDLAVYRFFQWFPWLLRRVGLVRTIHNTQLWTGMSHTGQHVEAFFQAHSANIAISESVQESYQKRYAALPPIIYNGVAPVEQRRYAQLKMGKINVLFAGRFEEQKGIDVLIAVIKALEKDERYHFHVMGSGTLQALVEHELSGMSHVSLSAPLAHLSHYLASFDYLFMPSRFEGLSILALEANFNGLPIVGNACPGLRDTLPTDWPLFVANNDMLAYLRLFSVQLQTFSRAQLQQQAYEFVAQHFSMATMQQRYEAVYKSKRKTMTPA
ncbi:MAG: glycosyltransferase family 4 protein [Prevotella sp.]|nr:glycosyltransferase family 4 protein [Prevotella sp.]